jgi:hypothetical protein
MNPDEYACYLQQELHAFVVLQDLQGALFIARSGRIDGTWPDKGQASSPILLLSKALGSHAF